MKLLYVLELSWKNLMNRKARTILTITGVIIGVSAVTFLIALGYGFERMTTSQIASSNALYVFETNLDNTDLVSINEENMAKIKNLKNVEQVEPGVSLAGRIINKEKRVVDAVIEGANTAYLDLDNVKLITGSFFGDKDKNKAIVSTATLKWLNINLNNYQKESLNFEVVVQKSLSPSLEEASTKTIPNIQIVGVIDDDKSVILIAPLDLLKEELKLVNYNKLKIKVADKNKISDTRREVESLGFYTNYIGDTIKQINSFFVVFRYIVGGFGFIGMLVAILGMFNTLTVSLLERIREIGVLKANGATRKDVWRIFLSEAIIISLTGGISGIVVGLMIGETINFVFNIYAKQHGSLPVDFFYAPPSMIIATILLITLVGFLTGLYPSKRASKIKVLDALKYE